LITIAMVHVLAIVSEDQIAAIFQKVDVNRSVAESL
jgi:hypothetical protein